MQKLAFIVFAIVVLFSCQPQEVLSETPSTFKINKGTNIAHWLSQSSKRGTEREMFFQEKDVVTIKEMGFDHLRLPIDEEQMWDENGARHQDAFQLLTNCLDWCKKQDLKVIVDLHILRSHHFNADVKPLWTDPKEQEKFYRLWIDLSSVLHKYPVSDVAYELMNEAVADDPEQWNNLVANAVKEIRKIEPDRMIVIGSNRWQSVTTFNVLKVPNDKNIILSFHFYEPFLLTHYHASWTGLRDYTGPVHYPGVLVTKTEFDKLSASVQAGAKGYVDKNWDLEKMEQMMQAPLQLAKTLGFQLYCGEYGVIKGSPEADRIRWYNDMTTIFNKHGIASANWNYKAGAFGLIETDETRNNAMIEAILKK